MNIFYLSYVCAEIILDALLPTERPFLPEPQNLHLAEGRPRVFRDAALFMPGLCP